MDASLTDDPLFGVAAISLTTSMLSSPDPSSSSSESSFFCHVRCGLWRHIAGFFKHFRKKLKPEKTFVFFAESQKSSLTYLAVKKLTHNHTCLADLFRRGRIGWRSSSASLTDASWRITSCRFLSSTTLVFNRELFLLPPPLSASSRRLASTRVCANSLRP